MTKILIAGIGGVGGYFGGLLAKAYHDNPEIEIFFLARGKNLEKIERDGLRVSDDASEFIVHPDVISDDAADFGVVDCVLLCTKTYGLRDLAKQIAPCVSPSTVLIPLQNGVNSREVLLEYYSSNLITNGCVYLISRLEAPGYVVKKGQVASMFFGLNTISDVRLDTLRKILERAEVRAEIPSDIDKTVWEKFIFLSSIATATTYFDANIHEIIQDPTKLTSLKRLINEVTSLARAKAINIEEDQEQRVMKILTSLPPDATSSMHSDFKNKAKNTELESLTGYVVDAGADLNISVSTFGEMYRLIRDSRP